MDDLREINERRLMIKMKRVAYWEQNKTIPDVEDLINASMEVEI